MNQCVPGWDLDDSTKINASQGVPSLDYEVAELTWENGQLAMHGLGVPRAGGTLESIVSQASFYPPPPNPTADAKDPAPWSERQPNPGARTTDAMVPCPNGVRGDASRAGCSSTGSRRVVRVGKSATCGGMSIDTWEREFGGPGFTSPTAPMISPGNTISGGEYMKTSGDDRGCVPLHSSSQNDKASMLDEVIEYLKQLQAQVHMMSRMNMNMPSMMLPLALQQQQLQMSMMGCMGMGVMDMNTIPRPPVPWDNGGDCSAPPQPTAAASSVMPDPLAALLACQNQPMTMDAYSRVAAMYQQLQQQLPGSKN
ncbi:hypothetical protein SASPL_100519 [Salvia splendens]|uniref:Phytochrome-interacting factor 3 n=1 Tax=Salvia splendens TaxID=180675 RepID=A0A8X8YMJ0_SALSN|nr:hypothetical protein SASPL_100519 [Salvia splendens]